MPYHTHLLQHCYNKYLHKLLYIIIILFHLFDYILSNELLTRYDDIIDVVMTNDDDNGNYISALLLNIRWYDFAASIYYLTVPGTPNAAGSACLINIYFINCWWAYTIFISRIIYALYRVSNSRLFSGIRVPQLSILTYWCISNQHTWQSRQIVPLTFSGLEWHHYWVHFAPCGFNAILIMIIIAVMCKDIIFHYILYCSTLK